jgi:hypothetical protein
MGGLEKSHVYPHTWPISCMMDYAVIAYHRMSVTEVSDI